MYPEKALHIREKCPPGTCPEDGKGTVKGLYINTGRFLPKGIAKAHDIRRDPYVPTVPVSTW